MYLWTDFSRDRRVGGSRPNQKVFCNTCNAPEVLYIETTDRRDFGGKPSKWKWGRVLSRKIAEFCRYKNSILRVFRVGYPSTIVRTVYRKQFYPNQTSYYQILFSALKNVQRIQNCAQNSSCSDVSTRVIRITDGKGNAAAGQVWCRYCGL